MALRPMPFLVDHWLSSTGVRCLSLEMRGAFIELICYCWASGDASLPDDDFQLGKISGLGKRWATSGRTCLGRFFCPHPTKPGWLTSKRVYSLWLGDGDEDKPKRKRAPRPKLAINLPEVTKFVGSWNMLRGVVIVKSITDDRQKSIQKLLNKMNAQSTDWDAFWKEMETRFPLPMFSNPKDYKPEICWFCRDDTITRIREGAYNWQKTVNNHDDPTGNIGVAKQLSRRLFGENDGPERIEGTARASNCVDGSLSSKILGIRNGIVPVSGR